jgi:hypothetical protein
MSAWETLAENKIQEAIRAGEFDNLPGAGQPLDLDDDLSTDPGMRMAHRLLKSNGFVPPWIAELKDLDSTLTAERARLRRAFERHRAHPDEPGAEQRLAGALNQFRSQIVDLNRRLLLFNLKAPSTTVHRSPLYAEREIAAIENRLPTPR